MFFSATHYPGSASIISGSTAAPASSAVTAPSQAQSCYVYSAVVCDLSGSCATVDPRVIITGVHVEGKQTKKKKQGY